MRARVCALTRVETELRRTMRGCTRPLADKLQTEQDRIGIAEHAAKVELESTEGDLEEGRT